MSLQNLNEVGLSRKRIALCIPLIIILAPVLVIPLLVYFLILFIVILR